MRNDSGGCGVGFILAAVVAIVLVLGAALLVKGLADYNDAEASRLYARSELEASHARGEAILSAPRTRRGPIRSSQKRKPARPSLRRTARRDWIRR